MIEQYELRSHIQQSFLLGRCAEFLQCQELTPFFFELLEETTLIQSFEESVKNIATWETKKFGSVLDFRLYRILIYALVRATHPAAFVDIVARTDRSKLDDLAEMVERARKRRALR